QSLCLSLVLLVSIQDYTHEFHKTKGNFLAIREREDLLGSVRKDIEAQILLSLLTG
ncbi:Golgi SNAP receptor complex member 1, partial [Ilyodon furcidens]